MQGCCSSILLFSFCCPRRPLVLLSVQLEAKTASAATTAGGPSSCCIRCFFWGGGPLVQHRYTDTPAAAAAAANSSKQQQQQQQQWGSLPSLFPFRRSHEARGGTFMGSQLLCVICIGGPWGAPSRGPVFSAAATYGQPCCNRFFCLFSSSNALDLLLLQQGRIPYLLLLSLLQQQIARYMRERQRGLLLLLLSVGGRLGGGREGISMACGLLQQAQQP